MTELLELQGEILAEVPQVDQILLLRETRRAVREFCRRTEVLRATTSPRLDVVAGQAEYTLPAVDNREIVRVVRHSVYWNADPLTHRSEDQLVRDGVELTDQDSQAKHFYQRLPHVINLWPVPLESAVAALLATYTVQPSLTAVEVDDFVIGNWYETIAKGAVGNLLKLKNKPWTNLVLSAEREREFEDGVEKVISDRVAGFGDNDYSVGRTRAYT